MTPDELDALLADQVPEDQFLEYKHAKVMDDKSAAKKMIREYVSGFANSTGGVLLVGVDEVTWTVNGCVAPGGDPIRWASRCLEPIAHFFAPQPRYQNLRPRPLARKR